MSKLIYVIPWAICDTDNLYIKRTERKSEELPKEQDVIEDWTVKTVIPSPDRRSRDVYIVLDVYRGYDFKKHHSEVFILDVTNSVSRLQELGYTPADDTERGFIRQKVLKWDKPVKHTRTSGKKPAAGSRRK